MRGGEVTPRADRGKGEHEDNGRGVGSPTKMQKVSSVVIGHGAADEVGEAPRMQSYEAGLVEMISAYREEQEKGMHLVHVRKKALEPQGIESHAETGGQ